MRPWYVQYISLSGVGVAWSQNVTNASVQTVSRRRSYDGGLSNGAILSVGVRHEVFVPHVAVCGSTVPRFDGTRPVDQLCSGQHARRVVDSLRLTYTRANIIIIFVVVVNIIIINILNVAQWLERRSVAGGLSLIYA